MTGRLIVAVVLTLTGCTAAATADPEEDHPSFHPCLHGNHQGFDQHGRWWDCTGGDPGATTPTRTTTTEVAS